MPPESAFLDSRGHGARWSGAYNIELLNRALAKNLGIVIFHAHGCGSRVALSCDDRDSANELLPRFQLVAPHRAHGSIVVGERSAAGMILMPNERNTSEHVVLVLLENGVSPWPQPALGSQEDRWLFEQQPFTDNVVLREILREKVIAVVGTSGGGSQLVPHLAAAGVGEIVLIDDQHADASNQFATPNLGWLDASLRIRKTRSAQIRIHAVNRKVKVTRVNARVPDAKAVEALKRAHIIVGCVNNLHARADLNEIAWRYCIPYVDIGLVVTVDERAQGDIKPLSRISGNIFTALRGGPCMWCTGFVSQAKLDLETGGRGRSYLRTIGGADVHVASFNGTLASEAANEVLRLVLGIRRGQGFKKAYDGLSGTLLECVVRRRLDCEMCQRSLAVGDRVWK